MHLEFLGGAREVGRSALLVNDRLLLEFGMATGTPPRWPVGDPAPEAVVASHGHLDHIGGLPSLLSGDARPAIHWTPPTRAFARLLAADTLKLHGGTPQCPFTGEELRRLSQVSETHGYREPFAAAGHEVTLFDAGHIPGSAHVLVDDGETRLLYTGDFHTDNQRLVAGSTARPAADVVVCESTYADVEHEDRDALEERFVDRVRTTLWEGGTVVAPAFAIGRTQELMLVCEAHDLPCYVDGMGQRVVRQLEQHPGFLRDPDAFGRAVSHTRFVSGGDGQREGSALGGRAGRGASREQRERIADQGTVVITTAGMLSGGPAMTYVPAVAGHPKHTVALTGYQVEGTPGRELLETGSAEIDGRRMPVSATVERYDFSAHADRHGLRSFLDDYRDARVLVTHGDRCEWFAGELADDGYDATAPELGETVTI